MLRQVLFFIYCCTTPLSIPFGSVADDPSQIFRIHAIPSIQSQPQQSPGAPAPKPDSPLEVVADENETVDNFDTYALPFSLPLELMAPSHLARLLPSSVISAPPSPEARSPRLLC